MYKIMHKSCPMGRMPRWEEWDEFTRYETKELAETALVDIKIEAENHNINGEFKISKIRERKNL